MPVPEGRLMPEDDDREPAEFGCDLCANAGCSKCDPDYPTAFPLAAALDRLAERNIA